MKLPDEVRAHAAQVVEHARWVRIDLERLGAIEPGGTAVIGTSAGSASFPAVVDETMVDGVVWAPTNNGQHLGALGMQHGSVVTLGAAHE